MSAPTRHPIVWGRAATTGAIMLAVALAAGPLLVVALWFLPSWLQFVIGLAVGNVIYRAGKAVARPWYRPNPRESGGES